jgi:hypothetical protein
LLIRGRPVRPSRRCGFLRSWSRRSAAVGADAGAGWPIRRDYLVPGGSARPAVDPGNGRGRITDFRGAFEYIIENDEQKDANVSPPRLHKNPLTDIGIVTHPGSDDPYLRRSSDPAGRSRYRDALSFARSPPAASPLRPNSTTRYALRCWSQSRSSDSPRTGIAVGECRQSATAGGRLTPSRRAVRAATLTIRVTAHSTIGWYIAKYLSHTSIFLDGFVIKNIIVGNRSRRGYGRPSDIGPAESAGGLRGDPDRVYSHE